MSILQRLLDNTPPKAAQRITLPQRSAPSRPAQPTQLAQPFSIASDGNEKYKSPDFQLYLVDKIISQATTIIQPKQRKKPTTPAKRNSKRAALHLPRVWNPNYPQTPEMMEANSKWITEPLNIFFDHEYEPPDEVAARLAAASVASVAAPKPKHVVRYWAKLSYAHKTKRLTHLVFTDINSPVTPERKLQIMGPPENRIVYKSLAAALCAAANYDGAESKVAGDRANARSKWRRMLPGGVPQMLKHTLPLMRFDMKLEQLQSFLRDNPERLPKKKSQPQHKKAKITAKPAKKEDVANSIAKS